MLLGRYIGALTVLSDGMVATTPSMSPVFMLLWREHITSSRVGTSGASAFYSVARRRFRRRNAPFVYGVISRVTAYSSLAGGARASVSDRSNQDDAGVTWMAHATRPLGMFFRTAAR
jgi:hypothetical protein